MYACVLCTSSLLNKWMAHNHLNEVVNMENANMYTHGHAHILLKTVNDPGPVRPNPPVY